jgi:perosamine synthetase
VIPVSKPIIGEEELSKVAKVLKSGMLAQGEQVALFEKKFSALFGFKHSAAVSNGTSALDLIMRAVGIKEGDEVIVPDFTFIATANAVVFQGAKPVFSDVSPDTFNIDPVDVAEKITQKTKAVIAVHLFGQTADMKSLSEICEDKNISLIEDACQAHGAKYNGEYAGSLGDAAAFSFYPTKNMTTGEGGMITSENDEIDGKTRIMRDQGQSEKYLHTDIGFNFRMTDIAAAIGLAQLEKLPDFNTKRRNNAECYNRELGGVKGLSVPYVADRNEHVYHQYVLKVEGHSPISRDKLKESLASAGIGSAIHYPTPIHLQPYYHKLGYSKDICPVSQELSKKVLSIPVHPGVTEEDIKFISNTIKNMM